MYSEGNCIQQCAADLIPLLCYQALFHPEGKHPTYMTQQASTVGNVLNTYLWLIIITHIIFI